MEKLTFSIEIDAPREKVWQVLWDDETYRIWTADFSEYGSYAVSDWEEGSEVLFLTGKNDGMFCEIDKKTTNEFIAFKHVGSIKNGEKVPFENEMKDWAGSTETYSLKNKDGRTVLTAESEIFEELKEFFMKTFPIALAKVKELAEK